MSFLLPNIFKKKQLISFIGAGESGKSTVVKQMKILHDPFTKQ